MRVGLESVHVVELDHVELRLAEPRAHRGRRNEQLIIGRVDERRLLFGREVRPWFVCRGALGNLHAIARILVD